MLKAMGAFCLPARRSKTKEGLQDYGGNYSHPIASPSQYYGEGAIWRSATELTLDNSHH